MDKVVVDVIAEERRESKRGASLLGPRATDALADRSGSWEWSIGMVTTGTFAPKCA